jgi:hypothetical protein
LSFEPLETRNLLATMTFQHGVGGYAGTQDTVIFSQDRDSNFGTEGHVSADQQDFNNVRQGLLRFDNIFGAGPGQIPFGATINSAILDLFVQDDSNTSMQMSLYRMLVDWNESTATWNTFGTIGGVQASEGESTDLPPDALLLDSETDADRPLTAGVFDVTKSLEYWASGAANFGWLVESAATNGWDFRTKESGSAPRLTITYNAPAATADFQILSTSVTQAEGNSGTRIARIDVARLGDISGAASINYTVTAGTATAGDDFVEVPVGTPGTLNFGANDALATIEVTINGDDDLEGFETVLVTLTGGDVVAGRDVVTVTIADDDILISEVLANVSNSSDDETDREYIELIGTPGADLTGYYFVVFESEEEENSGTGSGRADFVIDLSPYTFGANGVLSFVPGDPGVAGYTWEYASLAAPASNIVELTSLMGAGGKLEDSSQTYAIIRSPMAAIVQGTDYDTVGAYEDSTATAIGTGVGILDQLPAGAQLVDSVGVVEGGSGDRDRVATTAAQGHPGVHVHQPTGFIPGNVTSDAVSRRLGQTLPNSIGAWFNGDISDGNPANAPIRYLEDTLGFMSVVSPDGAVLTPGAPNFLRTVYFRVLDQLKSVAEADGTVTIRIERTGDVNNESLTVTYATLDFGSATEDVDYTGASETLTFNPGESFKDITIDINEADGLSEGFERFRVVLSDATAGFLITNGSPTNSGNPNGEATVTIADANVSIATFQNGVNGYTGTSDAYLDGELTLDKFGQDPVIRVDQAKTTTTVPQQALLKFDSLFGAGVGQVPVGARIFDAFLTLNVTNAASGADIRLFRMLQNWEEVNATWEDPHGNAGSSIVNGVTPDGVEATATADAIVTQPGKAGKVEIPLNVDTIQSWANGSLDNFGWSIISDDPTQWWFNSSEAFLMGTFKPELTILYTAPVDTDPGTFSFSVDNYTVNESGGTATVTVNRIGGSDGPATVDWAVSDGTGTLADITGASSGSVVFADGEVFKTFTVSINNDSSVERNETLNLTLSGMGLTFGRSAATLTIRDNDFVPSSGNLILNEIWINSPGNDPPHEFVELSGLANMGMGSLYYVAIEGLIGPNVGAFEKVVDLGAYSNGSNGLSLLTPQEPGFAFNVNPDTTHIQDLGTIAQENVSTNNDSTTYLLLYSPSRELTDFAFDFDWDNDGFLELPVGATIVDAVGVRTLGQADQVYGLTSSILSFTFAEVDAISRKRNDLDRNDGSAWFGGNLTSAGDDYLLYEGTSVALPVTGAAMTPGDVNTGTAGQSPLAALTSVTVNPDGTVAVTFNGVVSQVVAGDGSTAAATGSAITITDTDGQIIPIVDSKPIVAGIGADTLTLSFSGSGVVGGQLPAGNYRLNFVGNGMVANGRSVDVANIGTQINGFYTFQFSTSPVLFGDFNDDGSVDAADYVVWRKNEIANNPLPNDNGLATQSERFALWKANFGNTSPGSGSGGGSGDVVEQSQESAASVAVFEISTSLAEAESALEIVAAGANEAAAVKVAEPVSTRPVALQTVAGLNGRAAGRRAVSTRLAARASVEAGQNDEALVAWLASRGNETRGRERGDFKKLLEESGESSNVEFEAIDAVFEALGPRRRQAGRRVFA